MFWYSFDFFVGLFSFFSGLVVFCSFRKHLLLSLLSLEYLVLCVYFFMVYFLMNYLGDGYLIMIFLVFSVCEGVLGLSILVSLIRSHGNDFVNSLFLLKW